MIFYAMHNVFLPTPHPPEWLQSKDKIESVPENKVSRKKRQKEENKKRKQVNKSKIIITYNKWLSLILSHF